MCSSRFASSAVLLLKVCVFHWLACHADAQTIGDSYDKPGEVQKSLVPRELIPPSPALTPEDAIKTMRIAPGFRIELAAADPLVRDPVAMTMGPDGRMWVVEMSNYMPDIDGNGCDEPVGRVVTLADTDGDGRMDKRTVFQDGLIMPRALMLAGDGALIGAPPKLWFCRDKDGDGQADEKIELASDFGVQVDPKHVERASSDLAPNSPTWALDNWIYCAAYTRRMRFNGGQWITSPTAYRGQWGLSLDDEGHLFYNSSQDQLRADILPAHYLSRNPAAYALQGTNVQVATDQSVWPARVTPGVNRGYRPGVLRDGRLKEFTACCAPWLYRAALFGPEFYGNAFVCEPAGNLVKRNILTASGGTITAKNAYHESEFLTSTDERFRPVNLYTGPEGALYVVDLYRGVLESRLYQTSYLRTQIRERGLDKPIGLGRIYRIVPEGMPSPRSQPQMHRETAAQLVAHLSHADAWWRATSQRLLVERNDRSVIPALRTLATNGASPLGRLHALWTLEGTRLLDVSTVTAALKDKEATVRAAAVRLCEVFFKTEGRTTVLPKLIAMTGESAPAVQQQLALTLGEAADPQADQAITELVRMAPDTTYLRDAALSSLAGRELAVVRELLLDSRWTSAGAHCTGFLRSLARCIFVSRRADDIDALIALASAQPGTAANAQALFNGMTDTGAVTTKFPVKFKAEPASVASLQKQDAKRAAALTALMTWPGKPGALPEPPVVPLTAAQQARFDLGKTLFTSICAACHQLNGRGATGLAPPLVDSEWVLGSEQRLTRIMLHGLSGPISVQGLSYNLEMPAFGAFNDEQTAAILTYIRREWGHTAAPVEAATVKAIRDATSDRFESWLSEQLLKIP
ncbi:MAG: HEAT repeat domain-containing protein [Verrucomicrobiaceae bacterium]|nr:HEAT repeat domain-containing protein [Verrucomicrobiaceae bacterium]